MYLINSSLRLLPVLLLSIIFSACEQKVGNTINPPNIIVFFTDDQGYADLGVYGAEDFETPHLDQLASEGIRFLQRYVHLPERDY